MIQGVAPAVTEAGLYQQKDAGAIGLWSYTGLVIGLTAERLLRYWSHTSRRIDVMADTPLSSVFLASDNGISVSKRALFVRSGSLSRREVVLEGCFLCTPRIARRERFMSEPACDEGPERANTEAMQKHICDLVMGLPPALLPSLQEFIETLIRDTTR